MNARPPPSSFDRFDKPGQNGLPPLGRVLVTADADARSPSRLGRLCRDVRELLRHSDFIEVERESDDVLAELIIGSSKPRTNLRRIQVDYSGWTASVGPSEGELPHDTDDAPNPITSLFAAACSVAAVFRFGPWREATGSNLTPLTFSLLNVPSDRETLPTLSSLDYGTAQTALFGCGSIAHAFGWVMNGLRVSSGEFTLVDNGLVAEKNVRKYLGLSAGDLGRPKTDTLAGLIDGSGLTVVRRQLSANRFLRSTSAPPALAITCTDTAVSRRDIQSHLPGLVLDAWSGNDPLMLQAGVGWRGFGRGGSCLICNHWTSREPHPDREAAAKTYGYTAHDLASAIRENTDLPPRQGFGNVNRSQFIGQGNMCDEVPAVDGRRQYSVPFVAAAAGALLALEVVVLGDSRLWPYRRRTPSLRIGIHPWESNLYSDRSTPKMGCICQDEVWVNAHRRLWPEPTFGKFVDTAIVW